MLSSLCDRRSFAFSHSASQRAQQQNAEDIETGQASAAANHSDDDCVAREGHLASASSAPTALARPLAGDSPTPASPSQLQTRSSALSAGGISPGTSPSASTGVLSKLLSASGRGLKRSASGNQPVCLICLENLTHEDFEASLIHPVPQNTLESAVAIVACYFLRFSNILCMS